MKQFWSVDNGDSLSAVKCPRVVMTGNFETVVAPEPKEEPLAWFSFRKASVYRQRDGVVFVIDWTHADLRKIGFNNEHVGNSKHAKEV